MPPAEGRGAERRRLLQAGRGVGEAGQRLGRRGPALPPRDPLDLGHAGRPSPESRHHPTGAVGAEGGGEVPRGHREVRAEGSLQESHGRGHGAVQGSHPDGQTGPCEEAAGHGGAQAAH